MARPFCLGVIGLEVSGSISCDETQKEGEDNGPDDGDNDVHESAEAGALHELSGDKAGDQTYDDPPKNVHG